MTLLPKACSYGGALLLHNRTLVGNGLRGSHVADKLLYCASLLSAPIALLGQLACLDVRELIVPAAGTPLQFREVFGVFTCSRPCYSSATGSRSGLRYAAMEVGRSWLLLLHKPKALSITANSMKPARPHARLGATSHDRLHASLPPCKVSISSRYTLPLIYLCLFSSGNKCGTTEL